MYRIFGQNLKNFFLINSDGDTATEYRIRIAQVLKGLADYNLYRLWEKENPGAFDEVNNLVFEVEKNASRYRAFETFARDLWGYGYDAVSNSRFSREIIEDQLKIIKLCIGTQYWVEIDSMIPQF
jgi:hypothetical protein